MHHKLINTSSIDAEALPPVDQAVSIIAQRLATTTATTRSPAIKILTFDEPTLRNIADVIVKTGIIDADVQKRLGRNAANTTRRMFAILGTFFERQNETIQVDEIINRTGYIRDGVLHALLGLRTTMQKADLILIGDETDGFRMIHSNDQSTEAQCLKSSVFIRTMQNTLVEKINDKGIFHVLIYRLIL